VPTYKVTKGDNLTAIAKKFGTTASALYAANKSKVGANPNRIYSGLVLSVPAGGSGQAARSPGSANTSSDGVARGGSKPAAKGSPAKPSPTARSRGDAYKGAGLPKGGGPTANPSSPKSSADRGGGRGSSYKERGAAGPKGGIKAGTGRKRGTAYKG
jgi:LysM repeat protein